MAEVVLAASFEPLSSIALHVGTLHREVFEPAGFGRVEEKLPYSPPIERFGERVKMPEFRFEMLGTATPPRFWFLNEAGSELVQLQRDWVAHNWRRMPNDQAYPRYPNLRAPFERHLRSISDLVAAPGQGHIEITQCEVTYVNHINRSGVWTEPGDVDQVSRLWNRVEGFLPQPERVQFEAAYVIAGEDGPPRGRLHVALTPDHDPEKDEPRLVLTLTARGAPSEPTIESAMEFLDLGHEWIVRGFRSIATQPMRKAWGEL